MKIRRMRSSRLSPKDTNTPTDCVILIAFQPQKWFLERASILRYAYTACRVEFSKQAHLKCGSHWP